MSIKITDTTNHAAIEALANQMKAAMKAQFDEHCAPANGTVSCPEHGLMSPLMLTPKGVEVEYCCEPGMHAFKEAFPDLAK